MSVFKSSKRTRSMHKEEHIEKSSTIYVQYFSETAEALQTKDSSSKIHAIRPSSPRSLSVKVFQRTHSNPNTRYIHFSQSPSSSSLSIPTSPSHPIHTLNFPSASATQAPSSYPPPCPRSPDSVSSPQAACVPSGAWPPTSCTQTVAPGLSIPVIFPAPLANLFLQW